MTSILWANVPLLLFLTLPVAWAGLRGKGRRAFYVAGCLVAGLLALLFFIPTDMDLGARLDVAIDTSVRSGASSGFDGDELEAAALRATDEAWWGFAFARGFAALSFGCLLGMILYPPHRTTTQEG